LEELDLNAVSGVELGHVVEGKVLDFGRGCSAVLEQAERLSG
jgi:hypothetical protein